MATQRWTDEMLDNLASSVSEVKESVTELRESVKESVTELRESVTEIGKGMEVLRDTTQGLIEVVAKQERRMNRFDEEMAARKKEMERLEREQAESNKRFDVLLGEIRYLIRGQQEGGNS